MSRAAPSNPRWQKDHERRMDAVKICAAANHRPDVIEAVAEGLGVALCTVQEWIRRAAKQDLAPRAPGRKPKFISREVRRGVILSICILGMHRGVEVLRARHTDVPYRHLDRMKKRMARMFNRRKGLRRAVLEWLKPGRVWAMDFTEPKAKLDGPFKKLLIVRDLASSNQLMALAATGETALAVCTALESLFLEHGAPLVMKCDNGPGFRSDAVKQLCAEHGVELMYSPPYQPQYNGSAERGVGNLKTAIESLAELAGRPKRWTFVDVEQARLMANRTARPWGARGPTPEEVFGKRRRIAPTERRAFQGLVAHFYEREIKQRRDARGRMKPGVTKTSLKRRAIKKALLTLGYLKIRGGRVSTPI